MNLAGESFDYGPVAFLEQWDPRFTVACFDHAGLYAYGRQPMICLHNLKLQRLGLVAELAHRPGGADPIEATELPDPVPLTLQHPHQRCAPHVGGAGPFVAGAPEPPRDRYPWLAALRATAAPG